jgi:hypothetical protein
VSKLIENQYGVKVRPGQRVKYTGDRIAGVQLGTVVSIKGAYVHIRLDGQKNAMPFHPTWELEYVPVDGGAQ